MIYLDTHAVIYLYAGELDRFSLRGQRLIQENPLMISGMVALELQYLFEVRKLLVKPQEILFTLQQNCDLTTCTVPLAKIALLAMDITWTRDPFDRMIVSNAAIQKKPLLTKDQLILQHCSWAVW